MRSCAKPPPHDVQPPPGADFVCWNRMAESIQLQPQMLSPRGPRSNTHSRPTDATLDHVPNDPLFGHQWNLTALRMDRAWDINRGSTPSVIVAVIDSGVAFSTQTIEFDAVPFHLGARMFPGLGRIAVPFAAAPDLEGADRFVAPWDFVWRDANPVDMDGHGTHVAGTIGQTTGNGVGAAGMAFNVRLMPLKGTGGGLGPGVRASLPMLRLRRCRHRCSHLVCRVSWSGGHQHQRGRHDAVAGNRGGVARRRRRGLFCRALRRQRLRERQSRELPLRLRRGD